MKCFNDGIDWLVQELDTRFNETSSKLLVCTFSPRDQFHDFSVESLMDLANLYLKDSKSISLRDLELYFNLHVANVREDNRFSNLNNICDHAQKMVEIKEDHHYTFAY